MGKADFILVALGGVDVVYRAACWGLFETVGIGVNIYLDNLVSTLQQLKPIQIRCFHCYQNSISLLHPHSQKSQDH